MNWQRLKPYLAGLGSSSIFGFSFFFTKQGLETMDTFRLMAFRFSLAALVVSLLVLLKVIRLDLRGKDFRPLLATALLQPILYFLFETFGVSLSTTSQAGMMIALIPIFVTISSAIFLKEKPTLGQLAFIILSVSGVVFIVLQQGMAGEQFSWLGPLVLLGAVLSATGFNILSRRSAGRFTPFEITFVMMWVGAIAFNLISVYVHASAGNLGSYFDGVLSQRSLIALLYLGIVSSVVAFFLINYTLSQIPASQSAVFANLTTVISIAAGVFFRNEPFYWYHAIGATMILLGVWGTNYIGYRQRRKIQVKDSLNIAGMR